MLLRRISIALLVVHAAVLLRASDTYISGETRDCFGGKLYHPAAVEIYLVDPRKAPEIEETPREMQADLSRGDDEAMRRFFASYVRLAKAIRETKVLAHTQSDKSGTFSFHALSPEISLIVVGIAEREDDPAYYAYQEIKKLRSGKNLVTLEFDRAGSCQ